MAAAGCSTEKHCFQIVTEGHCFTEHPHSTTIITIVIESTTAIIAGSGHRHQAEHFTAATTASAIVGAAGPDPATSCSTAGAAAGKGSVAVVRITAEKAVGSVAVKLIAVRAVATGSARWAASSATVVGLLQWAVQRHRLHRWVRH